MFVAMAKSVGRLFRIKRDRSTADVPIIGSVAPKIAAPMRTFAEADKPGQRVASPMVPIIGQLRHGHDYANHFATEFLAWVRWHGAGTIALPVKQLVTMADNQFSAFSGLPMPPERNLLGAMKKQAGVSTQANVRLRDARGNTIGKTTVYTIRPVEMATGAAAPSVYGAPSDVATRRAA